MDSEPTAEGPCIFCLRFDGRFTAVEHIVPEALGNKHDLVLPRGVVCDRCNNSKLSVLDQALCDFWPIKCLCAMSGIAGKTGRSPTARPRTGGTIHHEDGVMHVFSPSRKRRLVVDHGLQPTGNRRLTLEAAGGPRMTDKRSRLTARALLKMAYETAWLDHGADILDPRFDDVRAAILGDPRPGGLIAQKTCTPHESITVGYDLVVNEVGASGLAAVFDFHGAALATGSLPRLPHDLPEHETFLVLPFA